MSIDMSSSQMCLFGGFIVTIQVVWKYALSKKFIE